MGLRPTRRRFHPKYHKIKIDGLLDFDILSKIIRDCGMSKGFSSGSKGKPSKHQNKSSLERKLASTKHKHHPVEAIIKLHLSGDLKGAEQGYRNLIAQNVADDTIYANLAAICLTSDRADEGIELLQKSLELNPFNPEALNNLGNALQAQGKDAEAIASYYSAIRLSPNYPEAYNNLGNVQYKQGNFAEAVSSYHRAIELSPNYSNAHCNLGNAWRSQGNLTAAIASFQRALQINPNYANAYYGLGNALDEQGNYEQAIANLGRSIQLNPHYADAHMSLGNVLVKVENFKDAVSSYDRALELNPNRSDIYYNLGKIWHKWGNLPEAIASYSKAIALKPSAETYNNLGTVLSNQGQHEQAIAVYYKSLELNPQLAIVYYNLAAALNQTGRIEAAISSYAHAIELQRDYPEAYINLGNIFKEQDDLSAAISSYYQALDLNPNYTEAYSNLGAAFQAQGNLAEAIANYHQALAINPKFSDARANLSYALLMTGDFKNGWQEYEYRFATKEQEAIIHPPQNRPKWDENLQYKGELILVTEQGLGDSIQFVRYAQILQNIGLKISIQCDPQLKRLFSGISGIHQVYTSPESASPESQWYPLMSIPQVLSAQLNDQNIPAQVPYLPIPLERVEYWQSKLRDRDQFIVGIGWQGNPKAERSILKGRSFKLENFKYLANIPNIKLVSLQKGFGSEQLDECDFRHKFVDVQAEISANTEFIDTGAIMLNCDLVITSDTAMAHLAGALGRLTWIALKQIPEWRWMLNRPDSIWYPTMRLFRQHQNGDWTAVFQEISDELTAICGDL